MFFQVFLMFFVFRFAILGCSFKETKSLLTPQGTNFEVIIWYSNEKLIALTFSDSRVSFDEKRAMLKNFKEKEGKTDPPKRLKLRIGDHEAIRTPSSFVTQRTTFFFRCAWSSAWLPQQRSSDLASRQGLHSCSKHCKEVESD